jgi:hypothetical protein
MILESIELEHVGPFRRKVAIGPLKIGINVLTTPNEAGKTTLPGGVGFLQRSVAQHPVNLPCGRPSSNGEGCWVYQVSLKQRWMI